MSTPFRAQTGRADARRNRARVLEAARRAFAEKGSAVSLAEVARRAGVGAGTVYRHFPSKSDLLEAVVRQRIDGLAELASAGLRETDSGAAFFAFCARIVAVTPANLVICEVVESDDGWPRAPLEGAGARFRRALSDLLAAAQGQGAVRCDVDVDDVLAVVTGCVAIQRSRRTEGGLDRMAGLMLDALRADPGAVTKPSIRAELRDEMVDRDETGARCVLCAVPIARRGTGRPARYCTPACRQKAHRRRLASRERSVAVGAGQARPPSPGPDPGAAGFR